jgi:hypothetical protein
MFLAGGMAGLEWSNAVKTQQVECEEHRQKRRLGGVKQFQAKTVGGHHDHINPMNSRFRWIRKGMR